MKGGEVIIIGVRMCLLLFVLINASSSSYGAPSPIKYFLRNGLGRTPPMGYISIYSFLYLSIYTLNYLSLNTQTHT